MQTPPQTPPPGEGPVRTCVGCRAPAPRSALVRLVLAPSAARVVVDEQAAAPGRGAWLHPDQVCLDQAERRRAVSRALRLAGPVDLDNVHVWFAQHVGTPA